jgi:hypothetical protein
MYSSLNFSVETKPLTDRVESIAVRDVVFKTCEEIATDVADSSQAALDGAW